MKLEFISLCLGMFFLYLFGYLITFTEQGVIAFISALLFGLFMTINLLLMFKRTRDSKCKENENG